MSTVIELWGTPYRASRRNGEVVASGPRVVNCQALIPEMQLMPALYLAKNASKLIPRLIKRIY